MKQPFRLGLLVVGMYDCVGCAANYGKAGDIPAVCSKTGTAFSVPNPSARQPSQMDAGSARRKPARCVFGEVLPLSGGRRAAGSGQSRRGISQRSGSAKHWVFCIGTAAASRMVENKKEDEKHRKACAAAAFGKSPEIGAAANAGLTAKEKFRRQFGARPGGPFVRIKTARPGGPASADNRLRWSCRR